MRKTRMVQPVVANVDQKRSSGAGEKSKDFWSNTKVDAANVADILNV